MIDSKRPHPVLIESDESISENHSVHSDNIDEKIKDLDQVLESPFPNLFEDLIANDDKT